MGSTLNEDSENFIHELQKVFQVMHLAEIDCVELVAYQLKGS